MDQARAGPDTRHQERVREINYNSLWSTSYLPVRAGALIPEKIISKYEQHYLLFTVIEEDISILVRDATSERKLVKTILRRKYFCIYFGKAGKQFRVYNNSSIEVLLPISLVSFHYLPVLPFCNTIKVESTSADFWCYVRVQSSELAN